LSSRLRQAMLTVSRRRCEAADVSIALRGTISCGCSWLRREGAGSYVQGGRARHRAGSGVRKAKRDEC
jgi:hypothetical protein